MSLSQEIVKEAIRYFDPIMSKEKITDKRLLIELEDGEKIEHLCLAASGKCGNNVVQLLLANTSDSKIVSERERVFLFQIDDLTTYLLREEDGKIFCFYQQRPVELPLTAQAKFLLGIAHLKDNPVQWEPSAKYQSLYDHLVLFLNHEE